MNYLKPILIAVFLVTILVMPANAGEPIGKIGVMNPTMFKCVNRDSKKLIKEQLDPWLKELTSRYVFVHGGVEYDLNSIDAILSEYPDAREESCVKEIDVDYGFNPYDNVEFNSYLSTLESECQDQDPRGIIVPITDTKIEGTVYEFHPQDPANPATSEWFGVPSRDVMVRARGITFEIYWGSNSEGYYVFPHLGAGPITINLELPPDAHPINKDVVIFSNGLEETWTIFMGFYRGDVAPPNPISLKTPGGSYLPFVTMSDIEQMSRCGSPQLPDVASRALPPPQTVGQSDAAMPNVGGVLQSQENWAIVILAIIVLVVLPVAGFYTAGKPPQKD